MVLIQKLLMKCLHHNVLVKALYVTSEDNFLADHLSRGKLHDFFEDAAEVGMKPDPFPTPIPEELLPMGSIWV